MKMILARLSILVAALFPSAQLFSQVQRFAVAGGGYSQPAPVVVAPGQLITVYPGIGNLTAPVQASKLPLPSTLGGIYATITSMDNYGVTNTIPVPVASAFPYLFGCPFIGGAITTTLCSSGTGITVQIPYELTPPLGGVLKSSGLVLSFSTSLAPPTSVAQIGITLQSDAIHIVRIGDTLTNPTDQHGSSGFTQGLLPPAIIHADGSIVSASNPAKIGETISIWAVGLGLPSSGSVATGAANPSPPLTTKVNVDFDFRPNAGPSMPWSGSSSPGDSHVPATSVPAYFAPGYVGLYQINVTIPAAPVALQPCGGVYQSNATVNIGGQASFDGAGICVAQSWSRFVNVGNRPPGYMARLTLTPPLVVST